MKTNHLPLTLCALFLSFGVQNAHAAQHAPSRPSEAQMEAVKACAAAKGVELPAPPAGAPPKGQPPESGKRPEGAPPPPPASGEAKGKPPHGPKLTDAQRAIVDACFKEAGIEPPHGRPLGRGEGPHSRQGGPTPSANTSTPDTEE